MKCFRRPRTWASVALLWTALAGTAVQAAPRRGLPTVDAVDSRVITLDHDRIRLGDLHPTAPRELLALDVAPAPTPGTTATISRSAVQAALRRAGADAALANGLPARQSVRRASTRWSVTDLDAEVRSAMASHLPLGVEIEALVGLEALTLPTGQTTVEVRLGRLHHSTPAAVIVKVDDRLVARQSITATLRGEPRTPTVRADMPRGAVVGRHDVEFATTSFDRLPSGAVTRRAELVGKRLIQPARAGRPIQQAAVEEPPVIERGATVRLVAASVGLKISRLAIAQEDGRVGDLIRVKPTDGTNILRARVDAAGEVRIDLGGGR